MSKEDGGQAFPVPASYSVTGDPFNGEKSGMSLRDYFAAQALGGLLANGFAMQAAFEERTPPHEYGSQMVQLAYAAADLMLAERSE